MHGESNGTDMGRVAAPHTGADAPDEQVETASVNAIRQMGWLLFPQGEAVRPLARCMMGEPAWFTRQISYADLRALIYAAKACNNRHDTRKLMAAFLPSRMVERWCPRTTNPADTEGAA